jgi:hypothetical protein
MPHRTQDLGERTLRACWATHCLEAGVPVHTVSARLGRVDLRTTARYAAARPEQIDDIADVLDRRHQVARRAGGGLQSGHHTKLELGSRLSDQAVSLRAQTVRHQKPG